MACSEGKADGEGEEGGHAHGEGAEGAIIELVSEVEEHGVADGAIRGFSAWRVVGPLLVPDLAGFGVVDLDSAVGSLIEVLSQACFGCRALLLVDGSLGRVVSVDLLVDFSVCSDTVVFAVQFVAGWGTLASVKVISLPGLDWVDANTVDTS